MFDTSRFFEPSFTASLAPQGSDMLDHLTTTNDRSIFFKVHEQQVSGYSTGTVAEKYKMLSRGDGIEGPEECLSIVNKNYRVVENEEIIMPMQEQMVNHFDPAVLADIQIKDHIAKNGAVCFAEYILPKMKGTVETETGHKTEVGLRFILKNTFDGSSSVMFYGGVIDFFCTNGMISGEYDVTKKRHTKNFNVDGFLTAFDGAVTRHVWMVDRYQKWADRGIHNTMEVEKLFRILTSGSADEPKKKNTLSDRLFAQYIDETHDRGKNVFSLVSAMTNYASHGSGRFGLRRNSGPDTLLKRQQTVSKWLSSKAFDDFLEVAA